ncbi:hypothetical protein BFJ69_g16999 [Fusarium oxysporum]|uniref:Uncharacterized protein n=1 Tax=Fusarium oxysporum TaxID=5507 RepID=A0A420M9I9_FUSOX|nr:hypothetical protein BFJ69_g16999 [Fusarium oxysporum]
MDNKSTTPTAPQENDAGIPPAVNVGQAADANLHSVSILPSRNTSSPPIAEPSESVSVRLTPPPLQNASASKLTVSNQERHSPDRSRSRSRSPNGHLPVIPVPGKTLFLAARAGNKQIFLRILQSGAEITEVESDGTTVLQAAAEENQLDVVLSLLVFGADPNLGGGRTRSPLLAATDRQHVQVVAALLEAGADPSVVHPEAHPRMKSAFHVALNHQNSEILSMLLRAAADPNVVPGLLHYACSAGTLDSVKQLLGTNLDINEVSDDGAYFGTALRVSVENSHTDIVKYLLEHEADPNITSPSPYPWQRSPLFAAVHKRKSEILSMLLRAGADPNVIPGLLHYACSAGTLDSVKQLLGTNLDINEVSDDGAYFGTALRVSVENSHTDIVKYLLEHEADPNITSPSSYPWQRSPLFAAVHKRKSEILSMLLRAGADPNVIPGLLHYACSAGTLDSVKQLLGAHADPDAVPGLLAYVAENNNLQFVKMMVEEGHADINSVHNTLGTALHVFAAKGQRDAMAYLLDLDADPNIWGGALEGLKAALTLQDSATQDIIICLDNLAATTCLRGTPSDSSQDVFLEFQALAASHGATQVGWAPGHTDIPGNEQADKLAKAASSAPEPEGAQPTLAYLRRIAR